MRNLTSDDVTGICSIYPSNGTRDVAASVAASGTISEDACDSTPRHGFQSECAQPVSKGCTVASGRAGSPQGVLAIAAALVAAAKRARRRPRASASVGE
jgi:hypothetical protein